MRNIVLVSIDSLRADHCGFMGYDRGTTPNLDRLANEGVVFVNAIAPGPATPQSMPAIFTGAHPYAAVDSEKFDTRKNIKHHLNRSRTIPEQLTELGYTTAGFSPNPFTSRYSVLVMASTSITIFLAMIRSRLSCNHGSVLDGSETKRSPD